MKSNSDQDRDSTLDLGTLYTLVANRSAHTCGYIRPHFPPDRPVQLTREPHEHQGSLIGQLPGTQEALVCSAHHTRFAQDRQIKSVSMLGNGAHGTRTENFSKVHDEVGEFPLSGIYKTAPILQYDSSSRM
jgi:hypothetical protein